MNAPFNDIRSDSDSARLESAASFVGAPSASPTILPGLAQFVDSVLFLAIGWATVLALASRSSAVASHSGNEWRFGVLIVALGTVGSSRILKAIGAYEFESFEQWSTGVGRSTIGVCLTLCSLCGVLWTTGATLAASRALLEPWLLGSLAAMSVARLGYLGLLDRWRKRGALARRVAIVGTGRVAESLIAALARDPRTVVTGVYDDTGVAAGTTCMGHRVRGSLDELIDACRNGSAFVCIALPLSEEKRIEAIVQRLAVVAVDIRLCPDAYGLELGAVGVSYLSGVTLFNVRDLPLGGWRLIAKEIEDRIIAAVVLAVTSPLFLLIAVAIKLDSTGPIFFRQLRHGYNNQLIRVFKFRTLYDHARDPNAEKLSDDTDPRITRVGAFLRRTMLDELPQFINVLRGEMSVVGPRPHAMAAKAGGLLYREAVPDYDARHRMKPGVTGWAQVNGWRGDTKTVEQIRQRVAHDLHYIEHWSVVMDLKIVVMTAVMALRALSSTLLDARRHAMPLADAGRPRPPV